MVSLTGASGTTELCSLSLYDHTPHTGTLRSRAVLLCFPSKVIFPHSDLTNSFLLFVLPQTYCILSTISCILDQAEWAVVATLKSQWLHPTIFLVHFTYYLWVGRESLPIKVVTQGSRQPPDGYNANGKRVCWRAWHWQ